MLRTVADQKSLGLGLEVNSLGLGLGLVLE